MKNNVQSHWMLRQVAEEHAPRTTINLWPKIESQANSRMKREFHFGAPRTAKMRAALGLTILVMLIGSIGAIPAVRAFAEDVIQRMGIAFINTDLRDSHTTVAKVEATRALNPPQSLTLEELQEQIAFPVMLPTWLPDGLSYTHISISEYDPLSWQGSGKKASVDYSRSENFEPASGILSLHANDGPISAPPLLAESRQQAVIVNGQPGYYVHGAWQDDGRGDPNIKMGILQWDDQADDAYLTWAQNGVTYLLEAHNLGLEADDLLRIAESFE